MNLIPFNFKGADVRAIVGQDGEPWFVAKDVADVLGYANTSKAINTHCKAVETCPTETGGQVRHVQIIPERDLYRLVMKSKLSAAEAFEEWVVGEVLPSIRKSGGYGQGFTVPQTRAEALRLAADLEEKNGVLMLENQQQALKIKSLENLFMPGETVPQFAKRLNGVNSQLILSYLLQQKWLYNAERDPDSSVKYRVYAGPRDKQWLTEKPVTIRGEGLSPFIRYTPVMLEEGARRLHDLYLAGKLPMKASWNGEFVVSKVTAETSL